MKSFRLNLWVTIMIGCLFMSTLLSGPLIITLEGNMGAGKTTLLNILSQQQAALGRKLHIIKEPEDLWRAAGTQKNHNLLELAFNDPLRWATLFSAYAVLTKFHVFTQTLRQASHDDIIILDRCPLAGRYIFEPARERCGFMSEVEKEIVADMSQRLEDMSIDTGFKIDGVIYLRTPIETCFQRAELRNRSEDRTAVMNFYQALHDQYERWLINKEFPVSPSMAQAKTVIIDGSVDFKNNEAEQKKIVGKIIEFIKQCELDHAINLNTEIKLDIYPARPECFCKS
jgi:deoxyadenosine/deoxycytidine kinase